MSAIGLLCISLVATAGKVQDLINLQKDVDVGLREERDYTVLRSFYHDSNAFTQGLEFVNGTLIEGTGLYKGQSRLRRVNPSNGAVMSDRQLADHLFGEGITRLPGDRILQLTWRENTGIIYSFPNLNPISSFAYKTYTGEGWGVVYDAKRNEIVVSDGSQMLFFWDPVTFEEKRRLEVFFRTRRLLHINELEMHEGDLLANLWYKDVIVRIDLDSGLVKQVYDFKNLYPATTRSKHDDCFNGIALNHATGTLYLTGKFWPFMFEVKLRH